MAEYSVSSKTRDGSRQGARSSPVTFNDEPMILEQMILKRFPEKGEMIKFVTLCE